MIPVKMRFTINDRTVTATLQAVDNDRPVKLWVVVVEGGPRLWLYYIEGVPTEGFTSKQVGEALKDSIERDLKIDNPTNTTSGAPNVIGA